MLIVKDNQPTLLDDLREVNWDAAEVAQSEHHTKERGHGRTEHRRGRTVDLQGAQWDGFVKLLGRSQGMRLKWSRKLMKREEISYETVYVVGSLSPQQANTDRLMELVRGHWTIENKLHHVRV